ncbi:MAG: hypothetical protein K2N63_10030 [Lachnospiraceae bacterium]|nr:hypothetical protein [Lachnospiraceae bacterium]
MKYKVLITGKNNSIIDDFFSQMSDDFEAVTTSNRYDDIIRHLTFYKPDVFVYCISGESRDNINQLNNARFRMMETRIPIVLVGAKEECDEVERIAVNLSSLTLYRPISIPTITARIAKLLEGWPRGGRQPGEPESVLGGILASKTYPYPRRRRLRVINPRRRR